MFAHLQYAETAIVFAARNRHKDIVELLMANGAGVNQPTKVCITLIGPDTDGIRSGKLP